MMLELLFVILVLTIPVSIAGLVIIKMIEPRKKI